MTPTDTVDYCRACGHARQIHRAPAGILCRGACWKWADKPDRYHYPDDHIGRCTSHLCGCTEFVKAAA